ncbi:MAG: hypothetical protein JW744_05245, partial [Candidatus Diapherotrites archaeon]|nr:hypothetical protein [Candidatus Diapherotrites archaeon]
AEAKKAEEEKKPEEEKPKEKKESAIGRFFSRLKFWGKKKAGEKKGEKPEETPAPKPIEKKPEEIVTQRVSPGEVSIQPSQRVERALEELKRMIATQQKAAAEMQAAEKKAEEKKPAAEKKPEEKPGKKEEEKKPEKKEEKPAIGKPALKKPEEKKAEEKPGKKEEGKKPLAEKPGKKEEKKPEEKKGEKKPGKKEEEKKLKEEEKKPDKEEKKAKPGKEKEVIQPAPPVKNIPLEQAPPEIKDAIRFVKLSSRARGWYGDTLSHKKASLSGWRLRKRMKLHNLRKKAKKKKLTAKEKKLKRKLEKDQRNLGERLRVIEDELKVLKKIESVRKSEEKQLEQQVKAAGIQIPKKELLSLEKGKPSFRSREDLQATADAIKAVAEEMAELVTIIPAMLPQPEEKLGLDKEIDATQRMIKGLEKAFYKRKISFNQFRGKLFEYQAKLNEMKIKKKFLEEGQVPEQKVISLKPSAPEVKAAPAPRPFIPRPMPRQIPRPQPEMPRERVSISPESAKTLERLASRAAVMPRIPPIRERIIERIIERPPEKHIEKPEVEAEKKAVAIEKAIERIEEKPEKKEEIIKEAEKPQVVERVIERIKERPKPAEKPRVVKKPKPAERAEKPKAAEREKAVEKPKAAEKPKPIEVEVKPVLGKDVEKAISEKLAGKISKAQMRNIEQQLTELMEKHDIPGVQLAEHIKSMDSGTLVSDFHKLISIIEEQRAERRTEIIKPAPGFETSAAITGKKKEKITGVEREIIKAKIETDFDRLLNLIKLKGIIGAEEAASQLGMDKKQVKEYAEVLERSRLLKVVYPPIGTMKLAYPGYLQWLEDQKKQKKKKK